jgi:hypothetical protein
MLPKLLCSLSPDWSSQECILECGIASASKVILVVLVILVIAIHIVIFSNRLSG